MRRVLLTALFGMLSCGVSVADVMLYTSRPAFSSVVATATYGFGNQAQAVPSPYTSGPVTFQDAGYYGFPFLSIDVDQNGRSYFDDLYPLALELTFAPTIAFGLELNSYFGPNSGVDFSFGVANQGFVVNVPVAEPYPGPVPDPSPTGFVGFVSDAPFNEIQITEPLVDNDIDIYNYSIAQATTPEPGSFVLLATGICTAAGAGWQSRRRLRSS